MIDEKEAWAAVKRRDRAFDGRFVTGVLSTGIYCRPSCAARHPDRANVRFFAGGKEAREAGLRACKRCKPDEVGRDEAAGLAAGLSPAAYARALREERAREALSGEERVTDAIYEAGFEAPSRFYDAMKGRLGMAPSAWANSRRFLTY